MATIYETGWQPVVFIGSVNKHVTSKKDGTPITTRRGNNMGIVEITSTSKVGQKASFPVWDVKDIDDYPVGTFGEWTLAVDNFGRFSLDSFKALDPDEEDVVL